ncbi:MAG: phosphotransferase [Bdellovibrionales bacterium]|nr:phosphotransferase [Bdellovibrionales bacterium]
MDCFANFLKTELKREDYKVLPLAGDASSRRYYRVLSGDKAWVLMEWDPFEQPETFPFLSVQKYFNTNQIRVPQVYSFDQTQGLFLLEDLGDLTLERRFWEFQKQDLVLPFYMKTLDELIKIHNLQFEPHTTADCTAFAIEFSVEKLLWELNYARKNLLEGLLQINLSANQKGQLETTFTSICEKLYSSPQVICHRDFHSRNVMIRYDEVVLIDFQDARLGPPVYDLVSLFYDSYVNLSPSSVEQMMGYYINNFPYFKDLNMSKDEFLHFYDVQAIQRCFKACGSFASFKMLRNDDRYLHYIPETLERVLSILQNHPNYSPLKVMIEDCRDRWENL